MDIQLEKKRFTAKRIILLSLALIGLIVLCMALFSSSGNTKLSIQKERVSISPVTRGNFQESIPVSGVVLPVKTIYLDALEGGRVEEKFVEDGAMVEKGQPIMRLSNTDLELSLVNQETSVYNLLTQMQISENAARQNTINKRNQLTDIESEFTEAKRKHKLNTTLYKEDIISKQEFLETQNNYQYYTEKLKLAREVLKQDSLAVKQETQQAGESYERTRKALELMRRKVEDLVVRAPIAGQITGLDAEIGQSIAKGERLGQLDVVSGFKVQATVDEHYISRIFTGQLGSFRFSGREYELEIKKVYTQVVNGRFQLDMHFTDEVPEGIRRGQSLQIKLALSQEKEALLVNKGSFYQDTGGNWIFKLSEDGSTAYRVPIQLGSQNINHYELLEGLEAGDRVITSGYDNFKDVEELKLN